MAVILSHSSHTTNDFVSEISPAAISGEDFYQTMSSQSPATNGGNEATVYVAVGKSVKKTAALLQWTFTAFQGKEVCLLHVHCPSTLLPTLLGRLPASQANPKMVAAFRHEEKEEARKMLSTYLMTCSRCKVKASIITAEGDEIQKEIVDLVNLHSIRKLVVGAIPDCMKGKKISRKASHVAKYAPPYCKLWFVNKGKLTWTRHACESSSTILPTCTRSYTQNLGSWSFNYYNEAGISQYDPSYENLEVDETKDEAYLKHKKLEAEALEERSLVKAMEMTYSREVKLLIDAENALRITIQEQEKLLEEKVKIKHQLQKAMRNRALLNNRAQEAKCRHEEVAAELKLIQASIATLRQEKHKLQWQKGKSTRWLDRSRIHDQCEDTNESKVIGLTGDHSELPLFVLSDLEFATCNFSESFRIGHGGYGIVYKGEILNRTLAVKKLHLYNMQRQTDFNKAVQVLGKLHHPRLVELIGVCLEPGFLVYEYLPVGNLHNYLCNNNSTGSLNWKIRAQIVADIASGLLFLHSSKPEKIIHGNLKPENILLDRNHRSKISDYADHMLMGSQTIRCPSFRHCTVPSGAFSYTDPEFLRTGIVTDKSDIYCFGLIILQLVTGKNVGGLIGEVRRAVSNGKLTSVLDLSASDWSSYVGRRLVDLGLQFCEANSRDRPELTPSLAKELERLPFLEDQTVPAFFLCPILQEIMHDPQVAADGFTYEGEALREWLENGNETSPMTNLKLSHLDLTSNFALRLAIQDWICKS